MRSPSSARRRAARELERVGIPLLRHHARARRERVAELHEAELARAVEDQVFGEAREVRADQRAREQHLGDEVAIADGVDASSARARRSRGFPAAARARSDTRSRRRRPSRAEGRGAARERQRAARDRARAARSARASSAPPRPACARCRCVYDGMMHVLERARLIEHHLLQLAHAASRRVQASIVHRRVAVAT